MLLFLTLNKYKSTHPSAPCIDAYHAVKERDTTILLRCDIDRSFDMWHASYLLAKEGDHQSVQFIMSGPTHIHERVIICATVGYIEAGLIEHAKKLLAHSNAADDTVILSAIAGDVDAVNRMLLSGSSLHAALYGYSLVCNIAQIDLMMAHDTRVDADVDDDPPVLFIAEGLITSGCYTDKNVLLRILSSINNDHLRVRLIRTIKQIMKIYELDSAFDDKLLLDQSRAINNNMNMYNIDYEQAFNLDICAWTWLLQGSQLGMTALVYNRVTSFILGMPDVEIPMIKNKVNRRLLSTEVHRIDNQYHGTYVASMTTHLFYHHKMTSDKVEAHQRFAARKGH